MKPFKVEKRNHPQVVDILSTFWELKKNIGEKEDQTVAFAEQFKQALEQRYLFFLLTTSEILKWGQ